MKPAHAQDALSLALVRVHRRSLRRTQLRLALRSAYAGASPRPRPAAAASQLGGAPPRPEMCQAALPFRRDRGHVEAAGRRA
ncbi:hypothetical protein DAI22_05g270600 [Oryza sativa Japonica Group]|nr:hypothetical protein DAI22_05g270600 [Oryza sativa Japonica Group]